VICEAETGDLVDLVSFASRPSGSNYLGEANALLAAIASTPSDVELRMVSDCLSAKMSADKGRLRSWPSGQLTSQYAIPQRSRILAAARPVFNLIRKLIEEREAPVKIDWVRSHTGLQDADSVGNERADKAANDARNAAPAKHGAWNTAGQFQFGMRVGGVEVLGSYRRAMTRRCMIRLVNSLAAKATKGAKMQGLLAAEVGHVRLLAWCAVVRKMKDHRMLKFSLLAMTRHLPSREVLRIRQARREARPIAPQAPNHGMGACVWCRDAHTAETNDHAICECQHPIQRHLRGLAAREAREYLLQQGAIAPMRVAGSARVDAWFEMPADGKGSPLWICAKVPAGVRAAFQRGGQLADAIGIAPKDLDRLLGWTWNGTQWARCPLAEVDTRVQRLSAIMISRAWIRWEARCAAFDKWWNSPQAKAVAWGAAKRERELKAHRRIKRKAREVEKRRMASIEIQRKLTELLANRYTAEARVRGPGSRGKGKGRRGVLGPTKLTGRVSGFPRSVRSPRPVGPEGSVERLDRPPPRTIAQMQALVRSDAFMMITDEEQLDKAVATSDILGDTEIPAPPRWY
jgi:ribonuclease HI